MKKNITLILFSLLVIISITGCKPKQELSAVKGKPVLANAPVVVYKTKADYSLHVPVTLSIDKKTINSYPATQDVYYGGDLALPISLDEGYFLDRRGIDVNSAFTKWTYYEYSRLPKTPSPDEIMVMMLDTDPFTEMYYCGNRNDFKNLEQELNNIIAKGKLSDFKRVK